MHTDPPPSSPGATPANRTYRTLWRWHFYAALFVMPFLVVLAVTGTIYCFQPQIESLLYKDRLTVQPAGTPRLADDALLARARQALPAGSRATTASIDTSPERSAEFVFALPNGEKESIYLNPYTGAVLGTLGVDDRFMQVDRMIHRKLLLGKTGELIMELAACWTLVMVGTGIALWWPRAGATVRGSLWPRFSLRGRPFWKSLHTVMGIWLALGALAFILTGLPWSGSWGKQFKSLATQVNLGSPPGAWGGSGLTSTLPGAAAPAGHEHGAMAAAGGKDAMPGMAMNDKAPMQGMAANDKDSMPGMDMGDDNSMPGMVMDDLPLRQTPWAVGATTVPQSAAQPGPAPIALDKVIAIARAHGLESGYDIAFPSTPRGVYTVSYFPSDPQQERTLHIDQYSGTILQEIDYAEYGAVSKAVSYGTSLHMGRYFGLANQLVCSLISLGLATMAVTGFIMWWKRRPARALGAPARLPGRVAMRNWKAGLVVLGVIFPLMGATMLAVWALDSMAFSRRSRSMAA
jgi:uncharacterized iron-regulated membrane protein